MVVDVDIIFVFDKSLRDLDDDVIGIHDELASEENQQMKNNCSEGHSR